MTTARTWPTPDWSRVLTAREISAVFGVAADTVNRWAAAGRLPSSRVGPRGWRRYPANVVEHLVRHGAP